MIVLETATARESGVLSKFHRSAQLHPELQNCLRQHLETKTRVEHLISTLSAAQLNWRPEATRWSIAQNIHHLNLEYREQLPLVEKLIETGWRQHTTGDGPFRHGWLGEYYCWFTEPPYRVKVPTLSRFKPPVYMKLPDFLPEYLHHKERVLQLIQGANGLHLAKLRARVTYLPWGNWSLSLGQWLRFFAIHERRHLWQMDTFLLHNADFPQT